MDSSLNGTCDFHVSCAVMAFFVSHDAFSGAGRSFSKRHKYGGGLSKLHQVPHVHLQLLHFCKCSLSFYYLLNGTGTLRCLSTVGWRSRSRFDCDIMLVVFLFLTDDLLWLEACEVSVLENNVWWYAGVDSCFPNKIRNSKESEWSKLSLWTNINVAVWKSALILCQLVFFLLMNHIPLPLFLKNVLLTVSWTYCHTSAVP